MNRVTAIRRPGWLKEACKRLEIVLWLQAHDLIPESLKAWMLVVPLRHALRSVYGSDWRAAWAMLWWTVTDRIACLWVKVQVRLLGKGQEWG